MDPFKYLLPRPPLDLTPQVIADFDALFAAQSTTPAGLTMDYRLPYPKWQFLAYLAETRPVLFHGTSLRNLERVEPRQSNDIRDFGAQNAIYATDDPIWALFFAILDRQHIGMGLHNAAIRVKEASGNFGDPFYFFSISRPARVLEPWCDGAIYILPRQTFEQDPTRSALGYDILVAQWASLQPALPIGRLMVTPQDFPFLDQIRAHDNDILRERIRANPDGFPWVDE